MDWNMVAKQHHGEITEDESTSTVKFTRFEDFTEFLHTAGEYGLDVCNVEGDGATLGGANYVTFWTLEEEK